MQIRLRDVYEQELGSAISDRTWQRLRKRLRIWDEFDERRAAIVRRAAQRRKQNPTARIDAGRIAYELNAESLFPVDVAPIDGAGLYEQICLALNYRVPKWTVYRWGREINCPFSMKRVYQREHLVLWAIKIFPHYQSIHEGVAS